MEAIAWIVRAVFGGTGDLKASYQGWAPGGVKLGAFLGELLNFLLIATAVFIVVVKFLGMLVKKEKAPEGGPVIKECPHCISEIPIKATRCKFCTSELRSA